MVFQTACMPLKSQAAGFILMEVILACTVGATLLGIGAGQLEKTLRRQESQAIAHQLRQVTDAAKQYVRDHYESIHQTASSGFSSQFTIEDLKNSGYLASSMQFNNSYQQSYQIQVAATELSDQPTQLSILVLSQGGSEIPQADAQQIAGYAGGDAGYVDRQGDGSTLCGALKTWVISGLSNVGYGHIGSLNFIRENEIIDAQSFLMRKKVSNHPEYNQMQTDLDMQANTIQGSDSRGTTYEISATSGLRIGYGSESATYTESSVTLQSSYGKATLGSTQLSLAFTSHPSDIVLLNGNGLQMNKSSDRLMGLNHSALSLSGRNGTFPSVHISADEIKVWEDIQNAPGYDWVRTNVNPNSSHMESGVYPKYLKLPAYEADNHYAWWEIAVRICEDAHSEPERYGRAFIVGEYLQQLPTKHLIVCTHRGYLTFSAIEEIDVPLNPKS